MSLIVSYNLMCLLDIDLVTLICIKLLRCKVTINTINLNESLARKSINYSFSISSRDVVLLCNIISNIFIICLLIRDIIREVSINDNSLVIDYILNSKTENIILLSRNKVSELRSYVSLLFSLSKNKSCAVASSRLLYSCYLSSTPIFSEDKVEETVNDRVISGDVLLESCLNLLSKSYIEEILREVISKSCYLEVTLLVLSNASNLEFRSC